MVPYELPAHIHTYCSTDPPYHDSTREQAQNSQPVVFSFKSINLHGHPIPNQINKSEQHSCLEMHAISLESALEAEAGVYLSLRLYHVSYKEYREYPSWERHLLFTACKAIPAHSNSE